MNELCIGLIGYGKMGRAHSHAYATVTRFFDHDVRPVFTALCARDREKAEAMARKFGWRDVETDWRELVRRQDVDLIDVCASNQLHEAASLEAIANGKHVLCEKPLALSADGARRMVEKAESAGVKHMVVFNYRFVPAIQLARKLIQEGKLGEIREFVGLFHQDWLTSPDAPMAWRLRKDEAGSGALGDLGAHIVDLARFLVGEITEVVGSLHTFTPSRKTPQGQTEDVTVDDAFEALLRFDSGASGMIQASRVAAGRKTRNCVEVHGSQGSLAFDFQSMNELQYFSLADDPDVHGFRTITATVPNVHPYASHWWGAGHVLGFDHTFVHLVDELLSSFEENRQPSPSFEDGARSQQVLDAIERSVNEKRWVSVE